MYHLDLSLICLSLPGSLHPCLPACHPPSLRPSVAPSFSPSQPGAPSHSFCDLDSYRETETSGPASPGPHPTRASRDPDVPGRPTARRRRRRTRPCERGWMIRDTCGCACSRAFFGLRVRVHRPSQASEQNAKCASARRDIPRLHASLLVRGGSTG